MATDMIAQGLAAGAKTGPGTTIVNSYLGGIAKRINIPTFVNSALKQLNFRRGFIAMDAVASIQISLPNWHANNTVNEAGSGGTAVFTAAIERLDGSIQQFKWSGANTSETVADGGQTVLTDPLVLTTPLKRGEWFAIRGNGQFSFAIVINSLATSTNATLGDGLETAASGLTDKTLSGTISSSASTSFGPVRVVGTTNRRSFALFGDSRVRGGASSPGVDACDGSGDIGNLARSVGQSFAYVNMGTASESLTSFLTNNTRRLALAADYTDVICVHGINDLIAGRTSAQLLADIATFCALPAVSGKRPRWGTIEPRPSSTDSWVTLANQTVATFEATRVTVNDTLRALKVVGLYGCFDICAAVESSINSGKYAIGNGGQAITADGLHMNAIGNVMLLQSGIMSSQRLVL